MMTPGKGLEWTPFTTGDGKYLVYISATAQRPPLPTVDALPNGGKHGLLAEDRMPSDFPAAHLVTPKKVVFKAPDGLEIHGQLFEAAGGAAKETGNYLRARWSTAADVARLALFGLLHERLCVESVSREPRLSSCCQ